MRYALIKDGEIVEYRSGIPNVDQEVIRALGKPYLLPVEVVDPEYNPISEVREGPVLTVEEDRVLETYTVRAKNSGEIYELQVAKDHAIQLEFERRCALPISFTVGGVEYPFHADAEARENILGVVVLIGSGVPIPDPREWTPYGHTDPVSITHAELVGLGAAIAMRKDALFTAKKQKQDAVTQLSSAADVAAYDITADWPE